MSSIWTDLYKRSSFESNALWENPSCRIVPGGWRPLCSLAVPQLSHVLRVERGLRTVKQDGLGEAGLCAFLAVCIFFFWESTAPGLPRVLSTQLTGGHIPEEEKQVARAAKGTRVLWGTLF